MPLSPGELIKQKLIERGWTQSDLAKILDRHIPAISEIIAGKRGVTIETAIQLAAAFDNEPQEWLALEVDYRLSLAVSDVEAIRQRTKLYAAAPIKEMERRGWIPATSTAEQLQEQLAIFFEGEPVRASLRSSLEGEFTPSQRAWCAQAKRLAKAVPAKPFNEGGLDKCLKELKRLAAWPERSSEVPSVLADVGIRFVVVEPLSKTKIDGAAFWLDDHSPAIALSIRFDRIDSFWHTLGHELSHIRHRDGESLDIDIAGESPVRVLDHDRIERRAEAEAAATWIDPEELQSFIVRVGPLYSKTRINQFANRLRVHPGIIVGQLQHRGELKYSACRDSLSKVRGYIMSTALTDGWGHIARLSKEV